MNIAAPATSFDTIDSYLSWDHDCLDALLQSARSWVEEGAWVHAWRAYAEFERGLDRHIRLEEQILFPIFEDRTGITGPTTVMREEHRLIRRALADLRDAIDRADAPAFRSSLAALGAVLPGHNEKEEHILYPATDRMLSGRERADLVARLQAE